MFSLAMLVRLGKVTEEDIELTFGAFRKLDVHNDGVLNSRSIIAGMIRKSAVVTNSSLNLAALANKQTPPKPITPQDISRQQASWAGPWRNSWSSEYGNWFDTNSTVKGTANEFSPLVSTGQTYGLQQNTNKEERYFSS